MQQVKQEIELNEKLVTIIVNLNQEMQKLNAEIKLKSEQVQGLISGVCLNAGLDFTTDGVYFSPDFKIIYVYDLPKTETKSDEPIKDASKESTKVRKMKS